MQNRAIGRILVYVFLLWPVVVQTSEPIKEPFCCPSFLVSLKVYPQRTFSTSDIKLISKPCQVQAQNLLVFIQTATMEDHWHFGFIAGELPEAEKIFVHSCQTNKNEIYDGKNVRQFKALRQYLWQPRLPNAYMLMMLKRFVKLYKQPQLKPFLYTKILEQIDKIIVIGDLHGGAKSIRITFEELFKKGFLDQDCCLAPHTYMIFTGDYSDRSSHSDEVWAILAHLKMSNPERVFLLRGNHESLVMAKQFDFFARMHALLQSEDSSETEQFLTDLFYSLPQALVFGCARTGGAQVKPHFSFLLFCHGGIENAVSFYFPMRIAADEYQKGMSEQPLIAHDLFSTALAQACPDLFEYSGLMWNDFFASTTAHPAAEEKVSDRGEMLKQYNSASARYYLEQQAGFSDKGSFSLDAIIRGHQHIPGGIARLLSNISDEQQWQALHNAVPEPIEKGAVYTCTSSPDALGPCKCFEDSYALIQWTDAQQWQLTPFIKTRIPKKFAPAVQESDNDDCATM